MHDNVMPREPLIFYARDHNDIFGCNVADWICNVADWILEVCDDNVMNED